MADKQIYLDKELKASYQVYADYAAATPTDPRVVAAMNPYQTEVFGNPSSTHSFGQKAAEAISQSRKTIASMISAEPNEIFFTGSGTESNNLAILGVARANKNKGNRIITTNVEHPSILNTCRALERDGFEVIYLSVGRDGMINLEELTKAINSQTILITTHYGNSELGVLQPIAAIGQICRENGIYFHVDACQATAYAKIGVKESKIDLLTFNGSKMYGPKGVAVLYVREGVNIFPIIYGGGQQQSLRSGTDNVPGIVGLAKAVEIIGTERDNDAARIGQLRDQLQDELEKIGAVVNVKNSFRLPNHLSVTLNEAKTTDLVKYFDQNGIAVSSGSACSATSMAESYVLQAIGLASDEINKTIRVSLGRSTTNTDITALIKAANKIKKSPAAV